jgi:hypothetical protein
LIASTSARGTRIVAGVEPRCRQFLAPARERLVHQARDQARVPALDPFLSDDGGAELLYRPKLTVVAAAAKQDLSDEAELDPGVLELSPERSVREEHQVGALLVVEKAQEVEAVLRLGVAQLSAPEV